jgi:hypothetical protein
MWRLGGRRALRDGSRHPVAYQHDARRQRDGTISIFDNGTTVFHGKIPEAVEESRAIVLELDEERMRASLVREYTHPDEQHADVAGNVQVLENGSVFVGWGRALAISEFGKDGELLFERRSARQTQFGTDTRHLQVHRAGKLSGLIQLQLRCDLLPVPDTGLRERLIHRTAWQVDSPKVKFRNLHTLTLRYHG